MKNMLLTVHDQGMTGIVPALEANDAIRLLGEKVDDLPFPFISPLASNDDYIRHGILSLQEHDVCGSPPPFRGIGDPSSARPAPSSIEVP